MPRNHLITSTNQASSTLHAAIAYARAGFRPTPTIDGRPRVRGWQVERFLDSEEAVLESWRRDDDGVGLLMGPCLAGDLVAIVSCGETGRATMHKLVEMHGRPPTTITGSIGTVHDRRVDGATELFVYRVARGLRYDVKLRRAFGRSSDAPTIDDPAPANLIRNRGSYDLDGGVQDAHWSLHGVEVCVRGTQVPVASGAAGVHRWRRCVLPAELPEAWYERLVEATNR